MVDNLQAHQTDKVAALLEHNPRVHLHFTPTHASWLNQVELFFSILERRLLRRGEFARQTNSATGSWRSSRTTTAAPYLSGGPTRAVPTRSRKSQ
jgi:transposase